MNDIDTLYFEYLLTVLDPSGDREGVVHVCSLLHRCTFKRRVNKDYNRVQDGKYLRVDFLREYNPDDFDEEEIDHLMSADCTWFEMLLAFAKRLDFLYEGSIEGRFLELTGNMGLEPLMTYNPNRSQRTIDYDQRFVDTVTSNIDNNNISPDGYGGLFPLRKPYSRDQRELEIWDQHSAYFRERFEGIMWTSTS